MRNTIRRIAIFAFVVFCANTSLSAQSTPQRNTQNIIFVMTDGLREEEVFRGAEAALMNKKYGHVENVAALKKTYWRNTPEARRETLMPFLWTVIAKDGQIYGNRDKSSSAYVTNKLNFSYPGYSETLCGFADPRVNSNDKVPNPNITVLEWLNKKPAYHGKVAAFGAWDLFPFIFNADRADFLVNAGYDPLTALPGNAPIDLLNQLKSETPRVWDEEPFDALTFRTALEYFKERKPRVFFISLGETDDWAHGGRYDEYLNAAHRADNYLKIIWETAQSMPEYRDHTTLIFSTDHGRGNGPVQWEDHGETIPNSKYIWMAFLGPDTKPLGPRSNVAAVTEDQIAATLAAFLGEDYAADVPKAKRPIVDVVFP